MISADGINEAEFITAIKELNHNGNYNRANIARKKLDRKHKIICKVAKHSLEISFYRKGYEFFRIHRSAKDNKITYYALKKPRPNPNLERDRDSWFSCSEYYYDCSREQFYSYCQEYPPFFEWLLWNQL